MMSPVTWLLHSPPVFKLDNATFPNAIYPKLVHYDGGFVCGPLRNHTDPVPEPFPPGTRVHVKQNKCTNSVCGHRLTSGTLSL